MIYFDNSATSRPKPKEVVNAVVTGLTTLCSNAGRSGHNLAMQASQKLEEARFYIADFFGGKESHTCVFTKGCTEALNLAITGIANTGDHFICTQNDHNSVLRPLFELEKQGIITISVAKCNLFGQITSQEIESLITPRTKAVIANHISNVNGDECDINSVGELCKQRNLLFIVDAAQSAGHKKIEIASSNISMLALAGHKGLLGPQGVGCLLFDKSCTPRPILFGGTGTSSMQLTQPNEIPESLESGTLPLPNILGLKAGVSFVAKHLLNIENQIATLSMFALRQLSTLSRIKIHTQPTSKNGVIAFEVMGVDSVIISQILSDKYNICTRPGLHCAPLKHRSLNTEKNGLVRASFSHENTITEISIFINALKQILKY